MSRLGLAAQDRIAIFLDKQFEAATSIFAVAAAGLVFVPVNPALRAGQVRHILADCNARVLITTRSRFAALESALADCGDLRFVYLVDDDRRAILANGVAVAPLGDLMRAGPPGSEPPATADTGMAAILYTSGSTGHPKGVVFSHRNLVIGAQSVSQYLKYETADRIINIPPYSFDFGLNQLFSAMVAGATAVLHNFVTAEELMASIVADQVTGVSGVPTVMIQLAEQDWQDEAVRTVRYLSTTGGRMPEHAVRALRRSLPRSELYLMYGLTEAFRSTYLPPEEVDRRPDSIGKAIPNAEVLVVRPDGSICAADEPGELVHKGALVTLGYWNDPVRTAERFRPAPGEPPGKPDPEIAVWSGDTVKRDADGFIYYLGRRDEMIKTSGYRVSPTEVEEAVYAGGSVAAAAAIGVEDEILGQTILVFAVPKRGAKANPEAILAHCRNALPAYMVPRRIVQRDALPLNPNGKIDRKALARECAEQSAERLPADAERGAAAVQPFFARWRGELLGVLGLKTRGFRSASEVYSWAFPDRRILPTDSFQSLGGDSLTYVNLYVGLSDHLGGLPEDWSERPVAEIDRLHRRQRSSTAVAPDILLRVAAMLAVISQHSLTLSRIVPSGAAELMMMISGMSFARFGWNQDPRRTAGAATRFFAAIYLPIFIYLMIVFASAGKVNWAELMLVENWVHPTSPLWWSTGWYIENLAQFVFLSLLLAFVPGIRRFSFEHKFAFAAVLVVCGLAAFALFSFARSGPFAGFHFFPAGYFWLFALGWLIAAATSRATRLLALGIIAASVIVFVATCTASPSPMSVMMFTGFSGMSHHLFWFWMIAGGAYLLFGRSIALPRFANTVIVVIARSMLFVYVFYLQISLALPLHHFTAQVFLGAALSIVLWLTWESFWRAWRAGGSSSQPGQPPDYEPVLAQARTG